MKKEILVVALIFGLAGETLGQTHQHAAATVIDGAKNPELIPDSVAYQQVLLVDLSLPDNPRDEDKQRQASHFRDVGLTPSEIIQFNIVTAEFRSAHNAWLARWNAAAEAADKAKVVFDPSPFLQQFEDLMQSTRTALKQNPIIDLKVAGYVQKHKANIQIHKGAAQ